MSSNTTGPVPWGDVRGTCGPMRVREIVAPPEARMSADWMPDLTVNHIALDEEHLEIFRRLKVAATSLDGGRDEAERALSALADAIVDNLAFEERMMEETLYPDRARHRAAHELFMADFTSVRDELRGAGLVAARPGVAEHAAARVAPLPHPRERRPARRVSRAPRSARAR